jgi:hypothetical protein
MPVSSPEAALFRISTTRTRFRPIRSYNETCGAGPVIYCVIPRELEEDLFEKMVTYYGDNANVTVIVDRRSGPDRRNQKTYGGMRQIRDRRRARAIGTFPKTDVA